MTNKKESIGLWIRDKEGQRKEIEVEIDVEGWQDFEAMEKQLLAFGEQGVEFLMEEGVKKNRKFWWQRQWKKIRNWLRTDLKKYK